MLAQVASFFEHLDLIYSGFRVGYVCERALTVNPFRSRYTAATDPEGPPPTTTAVLPAYTLFSEVR